MAEEFPGSVLFCCDHNAIRSPMAEAVMKRLYGRLAYVQSAGVRNDMEVDGFAIAVCAEIGVELSRHRTRSFDEMRDWGDDLLAFDLVIALSPASQRHAQELSRHGHLAVEYWAIMDPSGMGGNREARLGFYRQTRDQIIARMTARFGPPPEGLPEGLSLPGLWV